MRVLDLFSGIGGFALGLERAGMRTVAFCEQDPFCREWLAQRWPNVPCHPDIRWLDGRTVGPIDVVCGGFPCQDISTAGRGEGLDGARSGLWFEMFRIVCEVRPLWVVIENVPRLRTLGADRVYSDMESAGYTGWFFVVGADDIGAPHRRKRAWGIFRRMADADLDAGLERRAECSTGNHERAEPARGCGDVADPAWDGDAGRPARQRTVDGGGSGRGDVDQREDAGATVADTQGRGLRTGRRAQGRTGHPDLGDEAVANAAGERPAGLGGRGQERVAERRAGMADADGGRQQGSRVEDDSGLEREPGDIPDGRGSARAFDQGHGRAAGVDDAERAGLQRHAGHVDVHRGEARGGPTAAAGVRLRWPAGPGERQHDWEASRTTSDAECELGAAADGLPRHLGPTLNKARLQAAGNTIVPHIAELIGRVIWNLTP